MKKKVAVITRHSVANYGSILQSYATQTILDKLGYDTEIIDYNRIDEKGGNIVKVKLKGNSVGNMNKNIFNRFLYIISQFPNYEYSYRKFKKFRKKLLKQTEEYSTIEELRKKCPKADIYMTGSDQVWGEIGGDIYDPAYFLEFVPNGSNCISYSASFGKEKISDELIGKLPDLLSKFSNIMVREQSAVEIINKNTTKKAELVLDPTLLLNKEQWEAKAKGKLKYNNYILIYQLHKNKEFDDYAKNVARKMGLPLVRISPSINSITRSGKFIYMPTPEGFLNYLKNATLLLTDSFHGTVFSLIFNKQFIEILPGETSTRVTNILKLTNLTNRILQDYNDFSLLNTKIDFENVNEILDEERNKSIKKLEDALKKFDKYNINNIADMEKNTCCGCRACEQICPKKAIFMVENKEGFLEPQIDMDKCIKCGLCVKKCPQMNELPKEEEFGKVYAAKNIKEQLTSSSGGIFSTIAKKVLDEKGIVFGAAYNDNNEVQHTCISDVKDLKKLKGSKYVQSDTKNTFSEAKKYLECGKKVLYVGTPCQIAGLNSFLGKQYNNLLTVDFVCHGVPSPKLFKCYLEWEAKGKKITDFRFRSKLKKSWGLCYSYRIEKKLKHGSAKMNPYYNAFLNGYTYRECCYNCKYATKQRISDITLCDYWGIEKEHPEFFDSKGVSGIIVNSKKGVQMFQQIQKELVYIESTFDKLKRKNHNLEQPVIRPEVRDTVYEGVFDKDFSAAIKENLHYEKKIINNIKYLIPESLKNKIRK